jgi:hypothetical protein
MPYNYFLVILQNYSFNRFPLVILNEVKDLACELVSIHARFFADAQNDEKKNAGDN